MKECCPTGMQVLKLIEREDGTKDKWVLATGERDVMIGSSSDNLLHTESVTIK